MAKLSNASIQHAGKEQLRAFRERQCAYLGLHGDETVATATGQSGPLNGPTVEEVVVVFQIPNL